jgi:hypothetical protein
LFFSVIVLLISYSLFLEVPVNAADTNDETPRTDSPSSSPRIPSVTQRAPVSNVKPICLYVSNWTDDEKYKRRKDRMRFNDTQLAQRYIQKSECL